MTERSIAMVLLAQLACCVAAWHRLQSPDMGFGEALARSLALTLAGLGIGIQLLFALHLARFPWLADAAMAVFWGYALRRGSRRFLPELFAAARAASGFASAWALAAALALLALVVWVAPPANWDSMTYNLARVLIMMRENTLAPEHINTFRQLSFSPGFDLLHWFFLRYGTDRGIAIFSLLAYLLVVTGSFAVARRYGGLGFALRVALIVASLKLLPLEATSTKNDIGAAGMAVACLLGAARLLDSPSPGALLFLLLCAGYGLSTKSHFAFFGGPFVALVLFTRRQDLTRLLAGLWRKAPLGLATGSIGIAAVLALCLGSQWINLARFNTPFGPREAVARHENADGLRGAAANLARYAIDAADAPGRWWFTARRDLHTALFGPGNGPGASMPFHASYAPGDTLREDSSGFGLLGALLVIPCVLASLFRRGDALGRITAASLSAFFLGVCAAITWFSYNHRFLTLFFAASAPCLAAARPFWHDRKWIRLPVLTLAAITLAAAVLANQDRPLVDAASLPEVDPPFESSLLDRPGGRREQYAAYFHGPLLLDYLARGLSPGGRGLLVAGADSWAYPILFYGRAQHWLVMGRDAPTAVIDGETYDMRDCASLHTLVGRFDVAVVMEEPAALACLAGEKPVMTTRAPWGEVLVFSAGRNTAPK